MQEWEHKVVEIRSGSQRLQTNDLEKEQVGGWELVSVVVYDLSEEYRTMAYFKRPQQPAPRTARAI